MRISRHFLFIARRIRKILREQITAHSFVKHVALTCSTLPTLWPLPPFPLRIGSINGSGLFWCKGDDNRKEGPLLIPASYLRGWMWGSIFQGLNACCVLQLSLTFNFIRNLALSSYGCWPLLYSLYSVRTIIYLSAVETHFPDNLAVSVVNLSFVAAMTTSPTLYNRGLQPRPLC